MTHQWGDGTLRFAVRGRVLRSHVEHIICHTSHASGKMEFFDVARGRIVRSHVEHDTRHTSHFRGKMELSL